MIFPFEEYCVSLGLLYPSSIDIARKTYGNPVNTLWRFAVYVCTYCIWKRPKYSKSNYIPKVSFQILSSWRFRRNKWNSARNDVGPRCFWIQTFWKIFPNFLRIFRVRFQRKSHYIESDNSSSFHGHLCWFLILFATVTKLFHVRQKLNTKIYYTNKTYLKMTNIIDSFIIFL